MWGRLWGALFPSQDCGELPSKLEINGCCWGRLRSVGIRRVRLQLRHFCIMSKDGPMLSVPTLSLLSILSTSFSSPPQQQRLSSFDIMTSPCFCRPQPTPKYIYGICAVCKTLRTFQFNPFNPLSPFYDAVCYVQFCTTA